MSIYILCIRYPHKMPFFEFLLAFLYCKKLKICILFRGFDLRFALNLLKCDLFCSYRTFLFINVHCFSKICPLIRTREYLIDCAFCQKNKFLFLERNSFNLLKMFFERYLLFFNMK